MGEAARTGATERVVLDTAQQEHAYVKKLHGVALLVQPGTETIRIPVPGGAGPDVVLHRTEVVDDAGRRVFS